MTLWAVGGCLFEVALPAGGGWAYVKPQPEVTLLAEQVRDGRHHFRFRAERRGDVELVFRGDAGERRVIVRVAPEQV